MKQLTRFIIWLAAICLVLPNLALAATATTTTLVSATNPSVVGSTSVLTATVVGTNPTGTVTFKDGTTTLGTRTLSGTGDTKSATFTATFTTVGAHSLTAIYGGDSGNLTGTSAAVSQTVTNANTTTSVAASLNPSTYTTKVTFTATVVGYTPTGAVTFKDGTTTLGTGTLSGTGNSRTATFAITTLAVGARSITAIYAGDTKNATSASVVLTQTVNVKTTTTTLTSNVNPSTYGSSTTLTATITGASPTGTVTFKDGATVIGTGTVASSKATLAIGTLSVGTHSLTAVYGGDGNNSSSTSAAVSQTVNIKATTTATSSSLNPSNPGNAVTFTATVAGATPTGTVTFKDGTTTLGTGTLNGSGIASFTTSTLSAATHSITAVYSGDAGNATSTSAALSQLVTSKLLTTAALSSSNTTTTYGDPVVLTAIVSGTGSPTGTVTFKNGTTTIGTRTLVGGTVSLSVATLTAGTKSLTAVYGGDSTFANSTSSVLTQVVNKRATSITLTTSANPVTTNSYATLTATVSGLNVSGSVTFKDGATTLGSVSLTGNTATASYLFAAGIHSVTAAYGGNANNNPSGDSSAISQAATDVMNPTYQYGYDPLGNLNAMVDPLQLTTNHYYDDLNRKIQIQQPSAGQPQPTTTTFEYSSGDSLTKVIDPRNLPTAYTPDGLGQVKALSSPDSGVSGATYDAKGNILTRTDARGKVTTLTYDSSDRLTSVTFAAGSPIILEYDGGVTPTPASSGELTKVTDESGSVAYSYDNAGRLTSKTQTTNGKAFTVTYAWGDSGPATDKLTSITYPSGNRVNYVYGSYGKVVGITIDPIGPNGTGFGSNQVLFSGLTRNAYGAVTGWAWSDGRQNPKAYYPNGDVFSYELGASTGTGNAAGARRRIGRDDAGRITAYTHTRSGSPVTTLDQAFAYDDLGRLTSSTLGGVTTQYSYDANGNRTSKTVGNTVYTNTISTSSNRLIQTQDVGGTASVQYDAAGNLTSDGSNTFAYSDRGRMSSATNAGGTVNYLYNALGLRVAKSGPTALVATGSAYYVYDEQGQLLGEYDASGAPVYETAYLGGLPVGAIKQTGTAGGGNIAVSIYNVYADHLATPRVITRQVDQVIVWRWDTAESFGGAAANQDPSALGAFVYNQRFPGQIFDAETGMMQNWNREYNPRQGRYLQSDPIGLDGGINTYSYVDANPLALADPEGLLGTALHAFGKGMTTRDAASAGAMGNAAAEAGAAAAAVVAGTRVFPPAVRPLIVRPSTPKSTKQQPCPGTDKQFGKKYGEHMDEGYGSIAQYRQRADEIYNDANASRTTLSNGETRIQSGNDLLRLDPNGNFRSLYRIN